MDKATQTMIENLYKNTDVLFLNLLHLLIESKSFKTIQHLKQIFFMTKEQELYLETGQKLTNAVQSEMFGKLCFKINGKAFICFFQNEMVFKLSGDVHSEALSFDSSKLFDPSDKKRPMKEWVQVPFDYRNHWETFAIAAMKYVDKK